MLGTIQTLTKEKARSREGGRKGESIEVRCRGRGSCLILEIRRCSRKKGGSLLAFCLKNLMVAVSEDRLVKGSCIDDGGNLGMLP